MKHVIPHLFDRFGKRDRRTFFSQQKQRLVGFHNNFLLCNTELARFDFDFTASLVLRNLIQDSRSFVDFDLGFKHRLKTGLKQCQCAFDFFLA